MFKSSSYEEIKKLLNSKLPPSIENDEMKSKNLKNDVFSKVVDLEINMSKYSTKEKDDLEHSEGGIIKGYYEDETLKIMNTNYFASMFNEESWYYILGGNNVFVKITKRDYFYDIEKDSLDYNTVNENSKYYLLRANFEVYEYNPDNKVFEEYADKEILFRYKNIRRYLEE